MAGYFFLNRNQLFIAGKVDTGNEAAVNSSKIKQRKSISLLLLLSVPDHTGKIHLFSS